jgi:hypothetical protein
VNFCGRVGMTLEQGCDVDQAGAYMYYTATQNSQCKEYNADERIVEH